MNKAFVIALFVSSSASCFAQQWEFGCKAGVNFSKYDQLGDNLLIGLNMGGFASARFGKIILQPEILYSQQGESSHVQFRDGNNNVIGSADFKSRLNYINIPIIVKFNLVKGLVIQAGGQAGFPVSAKTQEYIGGGITYVDVYKSAQTVLSGLAGLGYEFPIGLTLDMRYDHGLTSNFKSGVFKNRVIQFSVGYKLYKAKR